MRLVSHACHIPPQRQSISEAILQNGQSIYEAKAFGRLFGFENVATTADQPLADMFTNILDSLDFSETTPDTVIYCHGNPVQYVGDKSPVEIALSRHFAFTSPPDFYELDQQTCSTMFWALDAARGFLRNGSDGVLILAGDSVANMPLTERHALGVTAVGDAFAGLLLDGAETGTQVDRLFVSMRRKYHQGRTASPEETTEFNAEHSNLVHEILNQVEIASKRPSAILPHNVNRLVWQKFCKDAEMDFSDIWLDLLPDVGHCYTVDAVTHLDRFDLSDRLDATLLSVGQGGFLGGCSLRKEAELCRL